MSDRRTAINLLRDHGFKLVRSRKHLVYKNNLARTVVLPSTPSDVNAWKAALADLKKRYGLVPESYRPKTRVRNPPPVPAQPAPMPVEAIAAAKPLTPEEQAILAKWQREEDRRLRKEARLLEKWEREEREAKKKFIEWFQIRAYMIEEAFVKSLHKAVDANTNVSFAYDRHLLEVLNAALSRGFAVDGNIHGVAATEHRLNTPEPESVSEYWTYLLEVKRVAPPWLLSK